MFGSSECLVLQSSKKFKIVSVNKVITAVATSIVVARVAVLLQQLFYVLLNGVSGIMPLNTSRNVFWMCFRSVCVTDIDR